MSKAETVASAWKSRAASPDDDAYKGLPRQVQDAIRDVVATSNEIAERVRLAEEIYDSGNVDHPLALEPDNHPQTSWAQRFEVVDGEVIEITKESASSQVKVVYRPDLTASEDVDPVSALESRLQAEPDPAAQEAAQEAAEEAAADQVRED